jgi:hypothetical protein
MNTKTLSDSKFRRAYKKWDQGKAYSRQLAGLTKAQGFGSLACTAFGMAVPVAFDWSQTTAQEIVDMLRKTPWLNDCIENTVHKGNIPLVKKFSKVLNTFAR